MIFPKGVLTPEDVAAAASELKYQGDATAVLALDTLSTVGHGMEAASHDEAAMAAGERYMKRHKWCPATRKEAVDSAPEQNVRFLTALYRGASLKAKPEIQKAINAVQQDPEAIRSVIRSAFEFSDLRQIPAAAVVDDPDCRNPFCPVHHPVHRYRGWGTHLGDA